MILVDAGPLVALINTDDHHHARCRAAARGIRETLGTVWPVVTEAMYLLGSWRAAQDALWELMESAKVDLLPLGADDSTRMRELMRKYRDLPMDLADAALVAVAERERVGRIFTVDRRDFEICRPAGLGRFSFIP